MNINSDLLWTITKRVINTFWLAILLLIIITLGGLSQEILTKLVMSEQANLYDTVYDGKICVCKIEFFTWLITHINFWLIIPSIIVVYVGMMAKNVKKIMLLMSFLIFLTLTIIDILINNDYELSVNVISNLLGSPVIAGILILSLELSRVLNEYFEINNSLYQKLINIFVGISVGLLLAFIGFIVQKNIYTLTTSKVDFTMKMPVYGDYKVDKKSNINYGLFSKTDQDIQNKIGNITWNGFSENFLLNWKKNVNDKTYKAEIRVIDECDENDKESINNILLNSPTYTMENINKIKLIVNDGAFGMSILPASRNNGIITLTNDEQIKFNIDKSKKKEYELSRIMLPSTNLNHSSWEDKATYMIVLPNIGGSSSKVKIINRKVNLDVDNKNIEINLVAKNIDSDKKMKCKALQESKDGTYNLNSLFGGVILTIQEFNKSKTLNSLLSAEDEETLIKGIGGWMIADKVNNQDIHKYIHDGELKSINFIAPLQELYIDENENKIRHSSSHVLVDEANLTGEITENGLIRFTGSSKAIYINGKRGNLSRWEKIDVTYKIAIATLLGGIILLLFNRVRVILTENRQYSL